MKRSRIAAKSILAGVLMGAGAAALAQAGRTLSRSLLPGAGVDLTVLLSVPEGAEPKGLVFTLRTISDKEKDVRVSLQP